MAFHCVRTDRSNVSTVLDLTVVRQYLTAGSCLPSVRHAHTSHNISWPFGEHNFLNLSVYRVFIMFLSHVVFVFFFVFPPHVLSSPLTLLLPPIHDSDPG